MDTASPLIGKETSTATLDWVAEPGACEDQAINVARDCAFARDPLIKGLVNTASKTTRRATSLIGNARSGLQLASRVAVVAKIKQADSSAALNFSQAVLCVVGSNFPLMQPLPAPRLFATLSKKDQ